MIELEARRGLFVILSNGPLELKYRTKITVFVHLVPLITVKGY